MAKKVTITTSENEHPLQNLSDPWGGMGPTTVNGIVVPADTEWGMNRGEVEYFIKSMFERQGQQISDVTLGKIGWVARANILVDGIEQVYLVAFATEEDYNAWDANHDDPAHQPIIMFDLPAGGEGSGLMYEVTLDVQRPDTVKLGSPAIVNVKGTSVRIFGGRVTNINEELTLTIRTRLGANGTWTLRETRSISANSDSYTAIDLAPYLAGGDNYVELVAIGNYASSLVETFKLTAVSLQLIPNTPFTEPFTDTLEFNYLLSCNVAAELQFEFGSGLDEESFESVYSYSREDNSKFWSECGRALSAGGNMVEGITFSFENATRVAAMLSPGVHTIRARLYVSETIYSDWIYNQYFVATGSPLVVVNNVQSGLSNWSNVYFFDWAASGASYPVPVLFKLVNADDHSDVLNSWTFNAEQGVEYPFTTQLAIPDRNGVIYATMLILDSTGTTEIGTPVNFVFTNDADFSPVPGAHFVLQPANRTNNDANRDTIVNEGNGGSVQAWFTGFDFKNDGWINVKRDLNNQRPDAPTYRALRIPAGRSLRIDYNPFEEFTGSNTNKNVTFEIDFRASNILDDEEPLLTIAGTHGDGKAWGFVMLPTEAYFMTNYKRVRDDQNVSWAEDTRMHVTVNVVYNLGGLNYVRIFVNGVMDREFNYDLNDRFTASGVQLIMGNSSSDLDIFGIRCNRNRIGTDGVMRDYKASLGTTEEKVSFQDANSIYDGEKINFADCLGKYNVIGYTGPLPKWNPTGSNPTHKGKDGEVMPTLYINIVGDEAHSGTLTNLECKGQGTTAMTYHDWNQQYKITDNTRHIGLDGVEDVSKLGKGYAIQNDEEAAKKLVGKINFASSMQSHKLGLTWIYTEIFKRLAARNKMSTPGQLADGKYPNARLSVFEKPFLFFHREDGAVGDTRGYEFKYLMTFGAGKGDKPTFGYFKNNSDPTKDTTDMMMVEGANNDRPLALFLIPWNEDVTYVTKAENSKEGEAWHYNGNKQINFGFGKTSGEGDAEYPSNTNAINAIKDFFNFAYLHNTRIEPYDGTIGGLMDNVTGSANDKMYWVTQDDGHGTQYNLYRWSDIHGMWVDAGIHKTGENTYEVLNMRTQYVQYCQNAGIAAESWEANGRPRDKTIINGLIIKARRLDFMTNGPARQVNGEWTGYFHLNDALYHSCFVKFFAGTDNRAKNTYYYTDPVSLRIRWMQDDLDTTLKTNNVGQNRKPYYVEEHDENAPGSFYWQGEHNGFYNLLEECYTYNTEIPDAFRNDNMASMMRSMLEEMASIGLGDGDRVMNYFLKRLLYVQDYFPAIAYNEQARKVYEVAAVAQSAGEYENNDAQAITQSCGSQRWSEYQWLRDRIMYISSWCEYGNFSAGTGFSWRGKNGGDYAFELTPAKYLYPRVGHDSGNYDPATNLKRVRVAKGQAFNYKPIHQTSDAQMAIRGIDYLLKIGDMNVPTSADQGTFAFMGSKLQEITVNPSWNPSTDLPANELIVEEVVINNATNIKRFIMHNVETATGALDLSKCSRLEVIDLTGSGFTTVKLPKTGALTEVHLPAGLISLEIEDCPNLATVEIEGVANQVTGNIDRGGSLTKIVVRNSAQVNSLSIVNAAIDAGAQLTEVVLEGVDWTGANAVSAVGLKTLADIGAQVTGVAQVNGALSFAQKLSIINAWGNVDAGENGFTVTYTPVVLNRIAVTGDPRTPAPGTYQYRATAYDNSNQEGGNDFVAVAWSYNDSGFSPRNHIDNTGLLTVEDIGQDTQESRPTARIMCTVTKADNSQVSGYVDIGLYERSAAVGDLVYNDGSYGPLSELSLNTGKRQPIGVCFYVGPDYTETVNGETVTKHDRRMLSLGVLGSRYWGPTSTMASSIENDTNKPNTGDTPIVNCQSNGGLSDADNLWDSNTNDFKQFTANNTTGDQAPGDINLYTLIDAMGAYPAGTKMPLSKFKNLQLMQHRDIVMNYAGFVFKDYIHPNGQSYPPRNMTELSNLVTALNAIPDTSNYSNYLYPAASLCNVYEPSAGGFEIAPQFKAGNWYLPGMGELCRIYWHSLNNPKITGYTGYTSNMSNYFWSINEYSYQYAWSLYFNNGTLYGSNGKTSNNNYVRAVCAF